MIGGAVGAPLRFAMSVLLFRALNQPSFPYGTLTINVLGSFLLACLTWAAGDRIGIGPEARLLLGGGLLGAFTTYSTFSVETVLLIERSRIFAAAGYAGATVVLCISAAYLGMHLARIYLS